MVSISFLVGGLEILNWRFSWNLQENLFRECETRREFFTALLSQRTYSITHKFRSPYNPPFPLVSYHVQRNEIDLFKASSLQLNYLIIAQTSVWGSNWLFIRAEKSLGQRREPQDNKGKGQARRACRQILTDQCLPKISNADEFCVPISLPGPNNPL